MTELPKSEIMGLLKDPSALIKVRNNASSLSHARRVPDSFHVVSAQYSSIQQLPACLGCLCWLAAQGAHIK